MTRKITLILALALAAIMPPAAHAYMPEGFIGVSPQSAANSKDFRLMQEAGIGSVRLPIYWSAVQAKPPSEADSDWSGFDREVDAGRRRGDRGAALRLGHAGMGL